MKKPIEKHPHTTRAAAFEAFDDVPCNPRIDNTIGDVIQQRLGRRDVLKGALATGVAATLIPAVPLSASAARDRFAFAEAEAGIDETHHVADGYRADILIRWGDPVLADAPPFDPQAQSARSQLMQFGYNNDFVGFVPIDGGSDRGLLCVNHEYTSEEVMFPGISGRQDKNDFADMTGGLVDIEMAAHGATIIEIALREERWEPVLDSPWNRRLSAHSEMLADGPAAGHVRLRTAQDPSGYRIAGTLNNCAGAITPWGTYLMAEENFHGYFWTDEKDADGERLTEGLGGERRTSFERYGVPGNWQCWGRYHDRFNVDVEPNEQNRFGYVVEVDPLDPASTPVKHTALGRFRHEGASTIVNRDGRVVTYMGDDARFEYLYRFVSHGRYDPEDRAANMSLLASGTLSVARFDADGTMRWLPLVFGEGPLVPENGFESEADVLIDARLAADALEATPMDRPEDVECNPATGLVYVMLTNNADREAGDENAANPRADNRFGHVVELSPPDGDHAADVFAWDFLLLCGDPSLAEVGARWHPATTDAGWFGSPDNCAFDAQGRLWIATDQGDKWTRTGHADGLYGVETQGDLRGRSKLFFRCPVGAELCGPCFTPDDETLFVAVQHPATDGAADFAGFERPSTFEDPATRWPDFDPAMPPRPAVVAIRRIGGGRIAG